MSAEDSARGVAGGAASGDEAQLIERYFSGLGPARPDVRLGIGDDAALLRPAGGCELVMTTDSLVEGTHFLPGAGAHSLGHRALVVNLSDIAAMGAEPCWALLSLTVPAVDPGWLEAFSAGLGAPLHEHGVALVGGNLARGPLNIVVQLCGQLPSGRGLTRGGARAGDLLCVSGTVGDAAAGRDAARGALAADAAARTALQARFDYPTARVALGRRLRELASACIDVSDGLWRDLQRLTGASGCGATVVAEQLPLSAALRASAGEGALQYALRGGEDYELLFTVPPDRLESLQAAARSVATDCTVIGRCELPAGLRLQRAGERQPVDAPGFDHFTSHR